MALVEYYKIDTYTKIFIVDWMICGVNNEWIPMIYMCVCTVSVEFK